MISSKKIVVFLFSLLAIIAVGLALAFAGIELGRYLIYIMVPLGAVTTIVAAVLASLGKLEKDV